MKNIDKIRRLFVTGRISQATNSEISKLTGISPHQQVYQLTDRLVSEGFLVYTKHGRSKLFSMASNNKKQKSRTISERAQSDKIGRTELETVSPKYGIEKLLEIGFERVGNWESVDKGIEYSLFSNAQSKKILYAFVSENRVLYIGKTIRQLNQRMYGYKNPGPTQNTNIKNNKKIVSLLNQGKDIDIYVFAPKEVLKFKGIVVNLAAGLEDSLIEEIRPPWNETGK